MSGANPILVRFWSYLPALKKLYSAKNSYYEKQGRRLLTFDKIEQRLEICKECDQFTGRSCKLCGCCTDLTESHFNKLAFPTEQCPADPPKWKEVE